MEMNIVRHTTDPSAVEEYPVQPLRRNWGGHQNIYFFFFLRAQAKEHPFVRNRTTTFHPATSLLIGSATSSPMFGRTAVSRTLLWTLLVDGMRVMHRGIAQT